MNPIAAFTRFVSGSSIVLSLVLGLTSRHQRAHLSFPYSSTLQPGVGALIVDSVVNEDPVVRSEELAPPTGGKQERLFVSAVDRDAAPVLDLGASDFEVKERDTTCRIISARLATEPMRIVVLIDNSDASVGLIDPLRAALRMLIDAASTKDEVALVTLARAPQVRVPPTTDRQKLRTSAAAVSADYGSGSALTQALLDVHRQLMSRLDGRWPVFVIITADHAEIARPRQTAFNQFVDDLRRAQATVHAVLFAQSNGLLTAAVARDLVANTDGIFETATSAAEWTAAFNGVIARIARDRLRMAHTYEIDIVGASREAEPHFEIGVHREGVTLNASRTRLRR